MFPRRKLFLRGRRRCRRTPRKHPPGTTSSCSSPAPGCSARGRELLLPLRFFRTSRWCLNRSRRPAKERDNFDMDSGRPLKIGITCYPSVGGSGILASALGEDLARRGYEVHFISYERPFRMPADAPRLFFHPVVIHDYGLFKYPDYPLPLSVKMAEVSRDHQLDVLHVHYAVPHATAAILARAMLPPEQQPRVVTTLHGTDTTLLGADPGYGPAIHHALSCGDGVVLCDGDIAEVRFEGFGRALRNAIREEARQAAPVRVRVLN